MKSLALYICAILLNTQANWTADDAYKWFSRILSTLLLVLMLYINWDKVREIFKKKKD